MITTTPIILQAEWANNTYFPASIDYAEIVVPKILEAQQFDLRVVLGRAFYAQVALWITNSNLLPAGFTEFTQLQYDAILVFMKEAVKNFAYARYLQISDSHNTRYGHVRKETPHSAHLEPAEKTRLIKYYKNLAAEYVRDLCEHLEDNTATFRTWSSSRPKDIDRKSGGVNFSFV